ncbi:MAG: PadR family transcriptional regulator [Candidatus Diapherotrites archaeon]|uniref:PadR family transcriptional regulator n=1 Tax=Candidatus Iainarchaeum sp. TaxID=3101447 RepID=A0A2D6M1D5_9ARCH|nr:PadR family transcriptional regulator [Candidatus Diapherotrites archaeon]|tara:strand:- start:504 stop:824 length:321 start_codon:yes stop_codon:yes gene_type:complete
MAVKESREIVRLREKLGIKVLWVYILSLLNKAPSHAYILRNKIEERFGFRTGNVTVYVVLYKLEGRGFVTAKRENNRKVYTITTRGKTLLKEAEKEFKDKQKLIFS